MDGLALITVAAIMFVAGMLFGKHVLAKKAAERATPVQTPDRLALAEAWQRGFDAAVRDRAQSALDDAQPMPQPDLRQGPHGGSGSTRGAAEPAGFPRTEQVIAGAMPSQAPGPMPPVLPQPHPQMQVRAPQPPPQPAVPLDPRVRALRNINITLYVAALLLVAAASLFIALALPAAAKVIGLGIVAAGFYVVGLLMHARSERLRPAAAAFTATGLALIPMTGLAHYLLLSTAPGTSWFVTSLVGTAAFIYAAGKLQSKIVAGLATTFLVSTAYSGGAVLNRGLIFYFLFSMLLATAITLVGFKKPRWITNIYVVSFTTAHRYLVPATLLAAIFSAMVLEARDYGWLFAAAALYYAVALLAAPVNERFWHLAAARAASMISVACFLHVGGFTWTSTFRIVAVLLLLQVVLLAQFAAGYRQKLRLSPGFTRGETWVLLGVAALASALGAEALLRDPFLTGAGTGLDLNWTLVLFLIAGLFLAAKTGGHFRWVPLGVAILSIIEPMTGNLGRQGLLFTAAAIGTWMLARQVIGVHGQYLRWAARIASVPAAGAMFSFAAAGWILQPRFAQMLPSLPGAESASLAALKLAIEVATFVGVVLALLVQIVVTARNLRHNAPEAESVPARGLRLTGESIGFSAAVLCASMATWSLSVLLQRATPSLLEQITDNGQGWSTVLWVGYPWDTILLWFLVLLALGAATAVLGHRRQAPADGTDPRELPRGPRLLVQLGGLLALGAALSIAAGKEPAWMVEVVALLGLAYLGVRILVETQLALRIGYSVLAQVLFSGTAWHVADRFQMDAHGQYALFAFTIAAGQSVRAYTARNAEARKPADPRSLLTLAAVAILVLVPLTYLAVYAGNLDQAGLLVQFLCLLLFAALVVKTRAGRDAGFSYVSIPAALGLLGVVLAPSLGTDLRAGGWLPTPLWDHNVAFVVLALLLIGILVAEFRRLGGENFRWIRAVVALAYWMALFGQHSAAEPGWQVCAALVGAAGIVVFASSWGIPLLLLGSAALVLLASVRGTQFIHELAGARGSEPLDTMVGFGATCVILLIAAIFGGRFGTEEVPFTEVAQRTEGWSPAHARVLFTASLVSLGLGGVVGLAAAPERYVYFGALLLVLAVFAAAATEVPKTRREIGYEAAALISAVAIQRCWWVAVDGLSLFATLYYWVIVLGVLATYEFMRKGERNGSVVLSVSAAVLSLAGMGTFFSSTLAQQLVVLLSFTAMLVFGLVTNRKIFTIWGAIGIAVSVLWFLRGFTFLLLLLIAAGLIALALWRLGKMNKGSSENRAPGTGQPPAMPMDPSQGNTQYQHPQTQTQHPLPATPGEAPLQGAPGTVQNVPRATPAPEAPIPQAPAPPPGMPWMRPRPQNPNDPPR
ncbi:hypothetical protein ACIGB6_10790 [Paeniglutamicibacter gangotriensis]|uniref:hypothetical protein n=1 Tax=Paeniglutamicibacter gangotriensis TaxID=254787 RepID=UPI0037C52166